MTELFVSSWSEFVNELTATTFGALGELFDGPHATPRRLDAGPYFLNIASLKSGRLDLSLSDHVSDEDFERWTKRVTPRGGDLLFSYETRLGEAALMPEGIRACLGRRMALLRPNTAVVDPRFLLYYYLGPQFQRTIAENTIQGATVPRIALSTMPQWRVTLPPLRSQRAIAEVLGALDDKIASNSRVGSLSVALADALFQQAVLDEETVQSTYSDAADIGGGGTPKTSVEEYWNGEISWATPTDVTSLTLPYLFTTSRKISEKGLAACPSSLYPRGSILMSSRATIGAFAIAQLEIAVNQGFIVVNARDKAHQWWLFHDMRSRVPEFMNYANGATFLELSRGKFKALPVRLPTPRAASRFNDAVTGLHELSAQVLEENSALAKTRDELLPLLMSGKLRVKDAEKVVEEIA
ncbi:restriction endonuclease subunit S [Nocardia farcinica]|uniref:restriction endonuclease subunit S n=1 Tax=Nocardia farcinica TaxID=37329 RepID=UPI001894EE3C|nr:restriction endonuclease subunit S [Nocardia farcinica]MBF6253126.1 restriction endonuclease subunit S [Nocardia farcinica]MBF6264838.1 restriction endonuclease subunit S [Nocardia farcinica]MBF6283624.1 restriction endonuclease subunit S [Nocardia farcinica]MBF6307423.1 restriction endonuclease subunit S [Nocardia farcinica]MBF6392510.1 restriction endonuclease subunit S [Nocardia farcinica]